MADMSGPKHQFEQALMRWEAECTSFNLLMDRRKLFAGAVLAGGAAMAVMLKDTAQTNLVMKVAIWVALTAWALSVVPLYTQEEVIRRGARRKTIPAPAFHMLVGENPKSENSEFQKLADSDGDAGYEIRTSWLIQAAMEQYSRNSVFADRLTQAAAFIVAGFLALIVAFGARTVPRGPVSISKPAMTLPAAPQGTP
jgi:hypothetical protein